VSNARTTGEAAIEVRVEHLAQLFDPFDPFPTPSRDLARSAEEFIVGWARELPRKAQLKIVVHVPASAMEEASAKVLRDAVGRHFVYRADRMRGDLTELFHVGRLSLAIGLGVLSACFLGGRLLEAVFGAQSIAPLFTEGLIILGWVANWRPLEIFLYDWWPLADRQKLYRRLASAPVELVSLPEAA
jgi:hypothetical protein